MLERPALLLRPPPGPLAYSITDAATGAVVGFARRVPPGGLPWWRRLLGAAVLAVHEQEDEPLVFTVRRAWGLRPRREVRDAEGQTVGSLCGGAVLDARGRAVAAVEGDGGGRVFRGRGGEELAVVRTVPGGLRVAFHPGLRDPFLRMLLLAAALGEP
jgi:hypothetical protein